MSSEINELYQQVVLDHYKRPRNYRKLSDADRSVEGYNPLCGDHLFLYLKMDGDTIIDIGFEGSGCAISKASASLMTESVKGKNKKEAEVLFDKFRHLLTSDEKHMPSEEEIGKLAVLAGVRDYPTRIKCAILAWHTLKAALAERPTSTVSTE